MVHETRAVAAVTITAATVSVAASGVSLVYGAHGSSSLIAAALSAAVVVAFVAVGAVVALARPGNRVGWLMLTGGTCWALGRAGVDLAHHGLVAAPGSVPFVSACAVVGSVLMSTGWLVTTVGVATFFPDGDLAGERWRWLPALLVAAMGASALGAITANDANVLGVGAWSNPIALPGAGQALSGLLSVGGAAAGLAACLGAVAQLVARWRAGAPLVRQQLVLFMAAVCLPIVAAPTVLAGAAGGWLFSVTALPLPFAIGFAILARGLYDLRTAANRTLVWVTLSIAVAATYALCVAGIGALMNAADANWLPWAATVVVALMFAPLRDGLQRAANRVTFGRWDQPRDVVAGLGQRLEAAGDVGGLLSDLLEELRTLGLRDLHVLDANGRLLAGAASARTGSRRLPLAAYGRQVGELVFAEPLGGLRDRDRSLLVALAGHVGGAVYACQLTDDLRQALERTVLAREEERRRLRRDLHDGLGPALAGHVLRLDVAVAHLGADSPVAKPLRALLDEMQATVGELRSVVDGLRPAALDDLGLGAALAQAAQRLSANTALSIDVQVLDLPPLPAAAEVAVYRIVTEAMTNIVRHANATRAKVIVWVDAARLRARVSDDGVGIRGDGGTHRSGHGLTTMRERAEELRGQLEVTSGPHGVVVDLSLPLLDSTERPKLSVLPPTLGWSTEAAAGQ